ncbi:PREDICTED: hydroxysteroid dehydrogenase-like protein 1 [Ceratosolen solmsi marchali]|uniref:Hydroxysteroid dehydrogenase-like protein 1 n=1 Tax=Ceratosolen solmsi marchali TaxID=326594 RepID=A0AAJ7DXW1_9HYME|nr:PREDICTED: hydroxysteroid dehydrogenase-like protein 1 [Ceratosolen solmsi marchali]
MCLIKFSITLLKLKPLDFKEKYGNWAVVTGSTDGIGKEYAKELARKNLNIVLISRNLVKLNKTKDEILTLNPSITVKIIQVDFSMGKDVFDYIQTELQDLPIGILVNNVGILTEYPMYFDEISEKDLWNIMNINIASLTIMTRMIIVQMLKRNKGAIVNISSASNLLPVPLMSVYSASKIYVRYFSDAIRSEYKKTKLTIQCLSPSYINTNLINFDVSFKNRYFFPDAITYVKSAIATLGRIDSTTGYWAHDLQEFILLFIPAGLITNFVFFKHKAARKNYIKLKGKNID